MRPRFPFAELRFTDVASLFQIAFVLEALQVARALLERIDRLAGHAAGFVELAEQPQVFGVLGFVELCASVSGERAALAAG